MKKSLLILTILCLSITGYSQSVGDTFVYSFITYEITSLTPNRVEVIDYNTAGGTDVVIPNSVTPNASGRLSGSDNSNNRMMTYTVASIGVSAFQSNGLTSVFIPPNVTSIDDAAFSTNQITSITIPNSVTSIGDVAFLSNQLTTVILGNGLNSIGGNAFDFNPTLTCVRSDATIPPTIFTGNGDTFGAAQRINIDLIVPANTTTSYTNASWTGFKSISGPLSVSDTFVTDNITYEVTSVSPSTVTVIDYNTAGGINVDIPATVSAACSTGYSVTSIGNSAFLSKGLASVTIPNTVTLIDVQAFDDNNLVSVTIPNSVTAINFRAFRDNILEDVIIGNGVTSLGDQAFMSNQIDNLIIGNSVQIIGSNTFNSNNLTSVIIPDSVTNINAQAFLTNDLTTVVLGSGVTNIGTGAFRINQLTNITIPSNVTVIGALTFSNNPLADVTSLATVPPTVTTGTNDTFGSIANRGTINLHIPPNTTGAYVTDSGALWTDFNMVAEDALSTPDFELANDIKIITTPEGIQVISNNTVKLQDYEVYSMTGAKVSSGIESNISTNFLSNGVYILKLDFDKGTAVKKFIK